MRRTPMLVLLCVCCVLPGTIAARARVRSIWDGVYTDAQAKRGEAVYKMYCALCHGATLGGSDKAPELVGDAFLKTWYGKTANDVFKQVQKNMPKDAPGILKPQQAVDLFAFIFSSNKFPVGEQDLAAEAEILSDIRIEKQPK